MPAFRGSLPWSLAIILTFVLLIAERKELLAQSGLRASLERLDTDGDGEVEPEEITPLARPYLEKITRASRMSIDRDNDIEDLQEAARRYHAVKNGVSGRDVREVGESTIKSFGADEDEPLVPQFGLAEVKFPYTQDDLDFADRTMRSHDHNGDGYIDRKEAEYEKWTHRPPFEDDLNGDDRLSRLELAQRYARRRLLDDASDALRKKAWRTGGEVRKFERSRDRREDSQWWRRGGNSTWLAATILGRFDANKNGRLESQEYQTLGLNTSEIDVDRNGELTREELQAFLQPMQEQTGGLAEGIPGWFYELDVDRDRQVSMSEFTTEWTEQQLAQFDALDLNGDGLLTSSEVVRSKSMMGGSYSNRTAAMIPPGQTIISEIEVDDDFVIGDLNVQLSLTHSYASYLDGYLAGPDGQRIELFTAVGGSDDNFDETIFDDQSRYPITKARPPFRGTYMPEGVAKRQPGLSHFNGMQSRGLWQLVIRGTRSDRFGMLHNWSLLIKPEEEMSGPLGEPPADDGPQVTSLGGAFPLARREAPEGRQEQPSDRRDESRSKIDYREIGQRMAEAVKAGRMTQEEVRQEWIRIKSGLKDRGSDTKRDEKRWSREDIERYRSERASRGR